MGTVGGTVAVRRHGSAAVGSAYRRDYRAVGGTGGSHRRPPESIFDATRRLILTSGSVLLGLRCDGREIEASFTRVRGMKESTTHQGILREGRQDGRSERLVLAS
jgi:hypothetical protein